MPDDRLIHRTLGHSEKIGRLTDFEFIVWLTYKLAADDFGVMRFSPVTLQEAEQRLERKPAKTVARALASVHGAGLIDTFGHQGRIYCYDPHWQTWQKITHPRQTTQPPPLPDLLLRCDLNTRWLFSHHPKGGQLKSWKAPNWFPGPLPVDTGTKQQALENHLISPQEDNRKNLAPVLVGSVSGGVGVGDRGSGGGKGLAYDGPVLTVFRWQLSELGKRLEEQNRGDFDLIGWFERVEADIAKTSEALPAEQSDRWRWLMDRLYRDAELKRPNLFGKDKRPGVGATGAPSAAKRSAYDAHVIRAGG